MLVNNENIKDWLNAFHKSFKSFCDKAPLLLSFKITPTTVFLYEQKFDVEIFDLIKIFEFDFSQDIKTNIKIIKDWLLNNKYPVMIKVVTELKEYNTFEIAQMVKEGIDYNKAIVLRKTIQHEIQMRIEKLISNRNELFVRNIEINKLYRYRLKMPSLLFLQKIKEKLDPTQAWELFQSKAALIKEII